VTYLRQMMLDELQRRNYSQSTVRARATVQANAQPATWRVRSPSSIETAPKEGTAFQPAPSAGQSR